MTNAISTLVGPIIEGKRKWRCSVRGADDCIYGIPHYGARGVVKFNPVDKSMTDIGPDLGGFAWCCGVLAKNGCIYCVPCLENRILKIDTINGIVSILDMLLPEIGIDIMWKSGALALDNCIYFMPFRARRIMKLDPEGDKISSVGDDHGCGYGKYSGTVVDRDGYIYGIPYGSKRIVKYSPRNGTTFNVGGQAEHYSKCVNGALARDGNIYAVGDKGVLKIDVKNNSHSFIENNTISGWLDVLLGNDGCWYSPPAISGPLLHVLKFDYENMNTYAVGDEDVGEDGKELWCSGAVASDGVIYCIPFNASQVLSIDPFKAFTNTLKTNMERCPEELGHLFEWNSDEDKTLFETSIRKFGIGKTFQVLEQVFDECLPHNELCESKNLYPFMIAASLDNSALSVVNMLLRKDPSVLEYFRKSSTSLGSQPNKQRVLPIKNATSTHTPTNHGITRPPE